LLSGIVVFHTLLIVSKLVEAQDAVESNVITAFGAERVWVPKVICPFWMNTWEVEVGIVPLSFVRYSCNLRHRFYILYSWLRVLARKPNSRDKSRTRQSVPERDA
jgi:hypothetical protein